MKRLLNWASDKVQTFTGEKERRDLVVEFKSVHESFKSAITLIIEKTNELICVYNGKISSLNHLRKEHVERSLTSLHVFLHKFGSLGERTSFVEEEKREDVKLPAKSFDTTEQYIEDIDWSKDDVFNKTFFKTILGVKAENRKHNLSMRQEMAEYKLTVQSRENQAGMKQDRVNDDIRIVDLYDESVRMIDETVQSRIVPELELVEAAMEAEAVKNYIMAGRELRDVRMSKDISRLQGTQQHKHYTFLRNTFLFYIMSRKIYDSPVLTKLLQEKATGEDLNHLLEQQTLLLEQRTKVSALMMGKECRNGTQGSGNDSKQAS